jgi:hypothetical protein
MSWYNNQPSENQSTGANGELKTQIMKHRAIGRYGKTSDVKSLARLSSSLEAWSQQAVTCAFACV